MTALFCDLDGNFPNHHPDPTVPKNLELLIKKVKEIGADFGAAYDGDADRIGVVDEKGEIIWGDKLMIIFSRDILKKNRARHLYQRLNVRRPCMMILPRMAARP